MNSWWGTIDRLIEAHYCLQNYVLECDLALEVLKREDTENTLFYADPTYLMGDNGEGRSSKDLYRFEMTPEDHEDLLKAVLKVEGKVMLSGYRTDLYDSYLTAEKGWRRFETQIDNKSAKTDKKRPTTECLWLNYPDEDRL